MWWAFSVLSEGGEGVSRCFGLRVVVVGYVASRRAHATESADRTSKWWTGGSQRLCRVGSVRVSVWRLSIDKPIEEEHLCVQSTAIHDFTK